MQTIVMDGNLQMAEALAAFNASTLAATAALPKALDKCETEQQMQKIIADRDIVQLAYINALHKSLKHTGPLFEQIAKDLACAAKEIEKIKKTHQRRRRPIASCRCSQTCKRPRPCIRIKALQKNRLRSIREYRATRVS